MKSKSYVGQRFGRLIAVERIRKGTGVNETFYLCKCDCGNNKKVRYSNLVSGDTRSCGCFKKDVLHARKMPDEKIRLHAIGRYYRRNASVAGREWVLSDKDVERLVSSPCFYCGFSSGLIGLDRVDSNKGYILDNVVPCCKICNLAKNDMSTTAFADWIHRVHEHCKKGWCQNV